MVGFDPETRFVYQYHGCHWEGCIVCFAGVRQRKTIVRENVTYKQHIKNNLEREAKIREAGFNLVVIWVHECPEEDVFLEVKKM